MNFRKIYLQEKEILENKKIIFLVWPRQVWKTTFLRKIFSSLGTKNKQFLNLENFEYHKIFQNFSSLENFIKSTYSWEWRYFLFLDEFQKVKKIDVILKLIFDEMPFVKVVLSWSNNIEINKNIKESFAWRKRIYNMWPLDFEEFILWKEWIDLDDLELFFKNPLNSEKINKYLEEFMIWWWYPEVVLSNNSEEKKKILSDIFDYWFNRDIVLYTQKMFEFKELVKQLAFWSWNTLSYSNLASLSNLTSPTVKTFIEVLRETFIVFTQKPFFRNKLKEINKSPKLYFLDPWFRNWFINRFDFSPEEKWVLFENFVLSDLIKKWKRYDELKFWRTNDENYEVDLVLEDEQKIFEIKFKDKPKEKDFGWIKKFLEKYENFSWDVLSKENFFKV